MTRFDFTHPFLLDGATGSELAKRGYDGSVCAESYVLEHPDKLQEIQKNYVEAGSNAVYAPTFSANSLKLAENHIVGQTAEYNRRLVAVSREICPKDVLIGGDMAPTGSFMAPLGELTFQEILDIYTEQTKALEEAGVDFFIIETMMNVCDARAALLAAKSVSDKPVLVTFTCDKNGRTLSGADVCAILMIMQGMGAAAFGLNCSVGPKEMILQLKRMHDYAEIPLIAKPNAGMPKVVNGQTLYDCPPDEFTAYVSEMAEAGVALFGGCCGTDASHIRALKEKTKGVCVAAPAPKYDNLLPAATEKEVFLLDPQVLKNYDTDGEAVIEVTEDLFDDIDEICDEPDEKIIAIRIQTDEDIEIFEENQYAIKKPLLLTCDDADLLRKALIVYQGRAMYKGPLTEKELLPLQKQFGLIY